MMMKTIFILFFQFLLVFQLAAQCTGIFVDFFPDNETPNIGFCSLGDGLITIPVEPEGGTFSGPGMTGNQFDPEAAGIGEHEINYTVTLPCGTISDNITLFVSDCCPITNIDVSELPACDPFNPEPYAPLEITISYTPDSFSSNLVYLNSNGSQIGQPISDPSGVVVHTVGVPYDGNTYNFAVGDVDGHCEVEEYTYSETCGCGLELLQILGGDLADCPSSTVNRTIRYRSSTPAELSLNGGFTYLPGLIIPSSNGMVVELEIPNIPLGLYKWILRSTEDPSCMTDGHQSNVLVAEPQPDCKDVTIYLNNDGMVGVDPYEVIDQTDPNYCPDWNLSVIPNTFDCGDTGPNTVSLTAVAQNPFLVKEGTCSSVVTVIDNVPPTLICSNMSVYFNGEETIFLDPAEIADAYDACGIAYMQVTPDYVTCEQIGELVAVEVVAIDNHGNESRCTALVSVLGLPCDFSTCPGHIDCNDSYASFDPADETFHLTGVNCFYVSPYNSDELAYIRHEFCGDGQVVAKLESVGGSTFGWAGISLRENCDPGSKKFEIIHNGSNLIRREARTSTNGYAFPQQYPIFNRRWFKLVRQGNQFSAYISPNGGHWQFIGAKNIVMPECIEAGLAVTNYQPNSEVTGVFSNVVIISDGTGCTGCLTTNEQIDLPDMEPVNSIQEQDDQINVFPNPATDKVMVEFLNPDTQGTLEVMDNVGRRVQSFEIGQDASNIMELSLGHLPKGVYFLRLEEKSGQITTNRLILN